MKEEKGEGERILFRGSSEKLLTGSKTRFVDISLETLDFLILTKIEEKERKERKKKKRKKKNVLHGTLYKWKSACFLFYYLRFIEIKES